MKKEVMVRVSVKAHKAMKEKAKKMGMTLKGYIDFVSGVIHS